MQIKTFKLFSCISTSVTLAYDPFTFVRAEFSSVFLWIYPHLHSIAFLCPVPETFPSEGLWSSGLGREVKRVLPL